MIRQTTQNLITALYPRLSHEDGLQGESNSISNQKRILESYAKQNGFTNLQWYTDDGYSGANFQRPGFQAMLADIEAGKVGTVIVKDMSRLGRNYLQVGMYTDMIFPQRGVRFIAMSYAKVLGATNRQDGYLEGNGYLVSWCVGHLVELAPPNVYDAKYVKWSIADLPILPQKWQYLVSASTKKQFGILQKLMHRPDVDSVICATDAG